MMRAEFTFTLHLKETEYYKMSGLNLKFKPPACIKSKIINFYTLIDFEKVR